MATEMQNLKRKQDQTTNAANYSVTAEFYDLIYRDVAPDDLPFYLELAENLPGPVLELGCGTGRVILELAKAGHRVVGLDASNAMLEKLKAKLANEPDEVKSLVELHEGSMEDFELTENFGLVIAPFRAFQHLLTTEAQVSCLECIKSHLATDGLFVFNAFEPNMDFIFKTMQEGPAWQFSNEGTDDQGTCVKRFHRNTYDMVQQLITVNWRFEVWNAESKLMDTHLEKMQLRWTYRYEAQHLLELCGFKVLEQYADYQKTPLGDKARELIFICR